MNRDRVNNLFIILVFLLLMFCCSCDEPLLPDFRKQNFTLSYRPDNDFDSHAKSWFYALDGRVVAILHWQGTGQLGAESTIVLLCLKEYEENDLIKYKLINGVLTEKCIELGYSSRDIYKDNFTGQKLSSKKIELVYDGDIAEREYYDGVHNVRWLRFDVKASENRKKAEAILEELVPLLKDKPEAEKILDLLEYKQLTKKEIITIANKEAVKHDVDISKRKIVFDKNKIGWKARFPELDSEMSDYNYSVVIYDLKGALAIGGPIWICVDNITGKVIKFIGEM